MRAKTANQTHTSPDDLVLLTREQARERFGGVSVMTLIRWEKAGILKPVRLGTTPTSMVFYRLSDLIQLVAERAAQPRAAEAKPAPQPSDTEEPSRQRLRIRDDERRK